MKIRFLGAAESVTGSRTLVSYGNKKILIDAGLFQGAKDSRNLNWYPNINVHKIDMIIVTHAHIDHSGLLPKLWKDGYRGPILCSHATKDLLEIMLLDSAHLQEEDAEFANKTGYSNHIPAVPLYTTEDAKGALTLIKVANTNHWYEIFPNLSIRFNRAGHILGSTFVEMSYKDEEQLKTITFSGDLGNGRSRVIRPPTQLKETDYLILESTYGDRLQPRTGVEEKLKEVVNKVFNRGGILIIPAFTVGRTQEILYYLQKLEKEKQIPEIPTFVDSPMANSANKIYLQHKEEHQLEIEGDKIVPPLCPQCFYAITSVQDSIALINKDIPMIVITASGMLTGGRVMHHLKKRLPEKRNAVLFTGFQAEQTKGALLQQGMKSIRIHHEEIEVNAEIYTLDGLSAHADYQDILDWLDNLIRPPKTIFINHGTLKSAGSLKEKIIAKYNNSVEVIIPRYMEEINLSSPDIELDLGEESVFPYEKK